MTVASQRTCTVYKSISLFALLFTIEGIEGGGTEASFPEYRLQVPKRLQWLLFVQSRSHPASHNRAVGFVGGRVDSSLRAEYSPNS